MVEKIKQDKMSKKLLPITLLGEYIRLEPLDIDRSAQSLFEASNGTPITLGERFIGNYDSNDLIWRYMFEGPFENVIDFKVYLQNQINDVNGLCFCVFDQATNREIGVFNLMNNYPSHFKIEIGSLWYTPIVQHTQANTEATYLILKHIFELGYHRIEWKCDARNTRSRRAALKMKFKFEGIQESHLIIKGCPHDTAWFRMLQSEWPKNQKRLEKMLYDKKQDQVDHVIWNKTDEATTTNPWTIENFEKRLWILAFGISLLLLFLFYNHNYATDFSMLSSSLISNLLGPMTVCFLVKAIEKKW